MTIQNNTPSITEWLWFHAAVHTVSCILQERCNPKWSHYTSISVSFNNSGRIVSRRILVEVKSRLVNEMRRLPLLLNSIQKCTCMFKHLLCYRTSRTYNIDLLAYSLSLCSTLWTVHIHTGLPVVVTTSSSSCDGLADLFLPSAKRIYRSSITDVTNQYCTVPPSSNTQIGTVKVVIAVPLVLGK